MINSPIKLFDKWYKEAIELDQHEPTAVAVATASKDAIPSVRILLLKGYDERGFCIYTNVTSRKGRELLENPNAALCFYWDKIDKQVRIEGKVEQVSKEEADNYFASRSRNSQIGAWASKQSQAVSPEESLKSRFDDKEKEFAGREVPRPPFWNGFRVVPHKIEFWEKRDFRLHKRTLFTKQNDEWTKQTLYP